MCVVICGASVNAGIEAVNDGGADIFGGGSKIDLTEDIEGIRCTASFTFILSVVDSGTIEGNNATCRQWG